MSSFLNRVGVSTTKGFTAQGERNLPKSDVSHLVPCQLSGKDISRPTTVYIRPEKLAQRYAAYAQLGQLLAIPKAYQQGLGELPPVAVAPSLPHKATARPVLCLNSGRWFASISDVARKYGLSKELIGEHLRGKTKAAKGRRMRYLSEAEIEAIQKNPAWQYDGELLPLVLPGTRKLLSIP